MPRRCPNGTRKNKRGNCERYVKGGKVVKLSQSDIADLLRNHRGAIDEEDLDTVKSRLSRFRYKKTFKSQYFTKKDANVIEKEYARLLQEQLIGYQAAARITEYAKGYIRANEI
jgi:hypothetical protein